METRIARLESEVSLLRADVGEIKLHLRALRDKVDALQDGSVALRDEIASAKRWGLALSMTLAGVMLTVMARAFGWIYRSLGP